MVEAHPHREATCFVQPTYSIVSLSQRQAHVVKWLSQDEHKITITVWVGHTWFFWTSAEGPAPPLGCCRWCCCEHGVHGLVGVCLNFFWVYTWE